MLSPGLLKQFYCPHYRNERPLQREQFQENWIIFIKGSFQGEKFIEDASVSHEIQCILILTTQI